MNTLITQVARTNILMSLNKINNMSYDIKDIEEIIIWAQSIQVTTSDNKTHRIPIKVG